MSRVMNTLNLSSELDCESNRLPSAGETFNIALIPLVMFERPLFFLVILCVALIIFLLGIFVLGYIAYSRRQTRFILEKGLCNLPTVVWRPRFVNYSTLNDGTCEGELYWDDSDSVIEWARSYMNERRINRRDLPSNGIMTEINNKKMGSSSITNILPRMARLNGPYGMYATVYGVRTKVIHVAHPVPARAILTGAGVVEIDGIAEGAEPIHRSISYLFNSLWRMFRMTVFNQTDIDNTSKNIAMKRRLSSSSQRMLTGSTKYPAYDHFKNFSGDGVFTANGSDWKAKRASVIHCLLRNLNTEKLLEIEANRVADSFIREVTNALEIKNNNVKSETENPVMNVVPMLQRSTIGLIYRIITHNNIEFSPTATTDTIRNGREKIESTFDSYFSLASMDGKEQLIERDEPSDCNLLTKYQEREEQIKLLLPTYLQSVTRIRMIVLAQSRSIWYLLPRWVYKAISPMYREEERTMAPIRKFAHLACENALPGSPLALLNLRSSHSLYDGGQHGSPEVSKNLLDEAITLLFAGQDTSAATLSWTLHLLSLHPDKQERLFVEIQSVLSGAETKTISKAMTSLMPYLDAVIKESMRLYPVAPFIVRKLTSDITIPMDKELIEVQKDAKKTISIPASTFACVWIYALHRNPKLWEQPDEFLPERWIDTELRNRDLGQAEYGAYMPFAIGPRNCLGQPLAQVILRIALARILDRFVVLDPRLEALQKIGCDGFDSRDLRKDMQAGFTVLPSNGLHLRLIERSGVM